jgi:hypothetical protein
LNVDRCYLRTNGLSKFNNPSIPIFNNKIMININIISRYHDKWCSLFCSY